VCVVVCVCVCALPCVCVCVCDCTLVACAHYRKFGGFGELHNPVRDGGQKCPEEVAPLLYTALQQPVQRRQPPTGAEVVSLIVIISRAKKAKMQKTKSGRVGGGRSWPYRFQRLLSRVNSALSFEERCLLCRLMISLRVRSEPRREQSQLTRLWPVLPPSLSPITGGRT
jgi:ABC-type uncharacterized transport system YnjBCD permease subunit